MPLAHPVQDVQHPPVDEAKIADVDRRVEVGDDAEQPVEEGRAQSAEEGLALAPAPYRVHDVVLFAPARDQLRDDLGRVLQVAVHDHDRLAGRPIEARRDGDLVPEVSRERQDLVPGVSPCEQGHQDRRLVGASIVDEDDLGRLAQGVEDLRQPLFERPERLLLVVDRDDDRKQQTRSA